MRSWIQNKYKYLGRYLVLWDFSRSTYLYAINTYVGITRRGIYTLRQVRGYNFIKSGSLSRRLTGKEAFSSEAVPPLDGTCPALATSPAGTRTVRQSDSVLHSHVAPFKTTPSTQCMCWKTLTTFDRPETRAPRRRFLAGGTSFHVDAVSTDLHQLRASVGGRRYRRIWGSRGGTVMEIAREHTTARMAVQHCSVPSLLNDAAARAQERRGGAIPAPT